MFIQLPRIPKTILLSSQRFTMCKLTIQYCIGYHGANKLRETCKYLYLNKSPTIYISYETVIPICSTTFKRSDTFVLCSSCRRKIGSTISEGPLFHRIMTIDMAIKSICLMDVTVHISIDWFDESLETLILSDVGTRMKLGTSDALTSIMMMKVPQNMSKETINRMSAANSVSCWKLVIRPKEDFILETI